MPVSARIGGDRPGKSYLGAEDMSHQDGLYGPAGAWKSYHTIGPRFLGLPWADFCLAGDLEGVMTTGKDARCPYWKQVCTRPGEPEVCPVKNLDVWTAGSVTARAQRCGHAGSELTAKAYRGPYGVRTRRPPGVVY